VIGRACSANWQKKHEYRLLPGKPLGRPRCRWVDNIGMDLGEVGWGGMDHNKHLWRALVKVAPFDARKFFSSCITGTSRQGLSST
jgi:hypothetical protein